eukprot:scaffold199937_cov20-Tisochrysis_lutea.AAC.1
MLLHQHVWPGVHQVTEVAWLPACAGPSSRYSNINSSSVKSLLMSGIGRCATIQSSQTCMLERHGRLVAFEPKERLKRSAWSLLWVAFNKSGVPVLAVHLSAALLVLARYLCITSINWSRPSQGSMRKSPLCASPMMFAYAIRASLCHA